MYVHVYILVHAYPQMSRELLQILTFSVEDSTAVHTKRTFDPLGGQQVLRLEFNFAAEAVEATAVNLTINSFVPRKAAAPEPQMQFVTDALNKKA